MNFSFVNSAQKTVRKVIPFQCLERERSTFPKCLRATRACGWAAILTVTGRLTGIHSEDGH